MEKDLSFSLTLRRKEDGSSNKGWGEGLAASRGEGGNVFAWEKEGEN